MNSRFLGDACDHWKGSILCILADNDVIRSDFGVVPMLTEAWSDPVEDPRTYRRLLHLSETNPMYPGPDLFVNRKREREQYFGRIPRGCDLFLDPDTGISLNQPTPRHIIVPEIRQLLDGTDRILMIYQSSGRQHFAGRLCQIRTNLQEAVPGVFCCAYECTQVAMLLISLDGRRNKAVCTVLSDYLRGTAAGRMRCPD
jgi:hypothetical protein